MKNKIILFVVTIILSLYMGFIIRHHFARQLFPKEDYGYIVMKCAKDKECFKYVKFWHEVWKDEQ